MYVWVCTRSTALSERGVGVEVRGHHSLSVSLESNAGCSSVPVITPISSHLPKPCSRSRSHSFLPAKSFWNLLLFSSSKGSLCLQECCGDVCCSCLDQLGWEFFQTSRGFVSDEVEQRRHGHRKDMAQCNVTVAIDLNSMFPKDSTAFRVVTVNFYEGRRKLLPL